MTEFIELDPSYSTTRCVRKIARELIANEIRAAQKPEDRLETFLFLPVGEERKGDGGLRTRGYFKKISEDKPLITVVTVVFNGEQYLEDTILSVINQNSEQIEYIVIDGASTDHSVNIIRRYEHAIDYWVSEKDSGIYDAMNKGITLSTGNYLIFVNVGDQFLSNLPFFFASELKNISEEIVVTGYKIKSRRKKYLPSRIVKWRLPSSHNSIFYPAKFLKKNHFDCGYKVAADFDQFLKFNKKMIFSSSVVVAIRDDGFVSSNKKKSFKEYSIILFSRRKYLYGFYWYLRYLFLDFFL